MTTMWWFKQHLKVLLFWSEDPLLSLHICIPLLSKCNHFVSKNRFCWFLWTDEKPAIVGMEIPIPKQWVPFYRIMHPANHYLPWESQVFMFLEKMHWSFYILYMVTCLPRAPCLLAQDTFLRGPICLPCKWFVLGFLASKGEKLS